MKRLSITLAIAACHTCLLAQAQVASGIATPDLSGVTHNDQLYPSAPSARDYSAYDGTGFIINRQYRYLSSGAIHYPRVPHELWRDRLVRLKQAGFNNVETYAFWNFHEPRENEWHFAGDADLEAFLNIAQDLGLTALVRVGPYVCAEWESGGWPLWLRFKPAANLRTNDPEFLKWNDHWYAKILPLVAKHQINRGGNVIMMQLENEHPVGWGVVNEDPYFQHLREQAEKHNIEVPWFFSGLHHGSNPTPQDLDPATRLSPWFSSEFWPGWFDSYGSISEKKLRAVEAATWTIMAHGGGGHNYYMLHGGSNFDSWSDDSTGSSYDFGAAIGQAGDLRPIYYRMKRANLLAQSFPAISSNSTSVLAEYKDAAKGAKIEVLGARQGPGGTLLFVRNQGSQESTAVFSDGTFTRLARSSVMALPRGVAIEPGVQIDSSNLGLLCVARNEGVSTVVLYGQPGENGIIALTTPQAREIKLLVPVDNIAEAQIDLGGRMLRILAVPQDLSLRTWCIGSSDRQILVFGPDFVQDVTMDNDCPQVTYERYIGQPSSGQIAVYGGHGRSWHFMAQANESLERSLAPVLGLWKKITADDPVTPTFEDKAWYSSEQAMQMGADGDNGSYAWYRANFDVQRAGAGTISLKAKDHALVFHNGKIVTGRDDLYQVGLTSGINSLAVFVSQAGRNKGFAYLKAAAELSPKGILGAVVLTQENVKTPILNWKLHGGAGLDSKVWLNPKAVSNWTALGKETGGPAFFHTTFSADPPSGLGIYQILRLKWTGLTRGMVWVNGHSLGRYPEKIRVDSLYVPESWLKAGENDLVIFDELGASPKGVSLIVDRASREVVKTGPVANKLISFVVPQENAFLDLAKLNAGNVALNSAATSSGNLSSATPAAYVSDGDPESVWKAPKESPVNPSLPPWVAVDLGKMTEFGIIEILWDGKSRDYKYFVEGSVDSQKWTRIGDQDSAVRTSPDSPSELSRLRLHGENHRYLRVAIEAGRSIGIAEVRVFPHSEN